MKNLLKKFITKDFYAAAAPVATVIGAVVTFLSLEIALVALGAVIGAYTSAGRKEVLEEQVARLNADLKDKSAKSEQLYSQLSQCQNNLPLQPGGEHRGEPGLKLTITPNDSGSIEGKLTVSVANISALYNPLRYSVTIVTGSPGKPSRTHPPLTVGESVIYSGYEIRLLEANLARATFSVLELSAVH